MTDATLFVGGRIFTGRRYAEALLVEDGRVAAVGAEASARRAAATGTERVDLAHGLVVPGLADAHLHLGDLTRSREGLDAGSVASVRELCRRLASWAEAHPARAIVGGGLDPAALVEHRWPTLAELDAAVPDRPVVLYHASGHAAAVNSAALERAFDGGPPPPGDGAPSGVLTEDALDALRPVVGEAQPLTIASMEATVRDLAGYGVTSVGTMSTGADELSVLRRLDAAGELPLLVRAYPPINELLGHRGPREPGPSSRVVVVGVKAFLDGAFGTRTAALVEAYSDEPTTHGVDRGDDAALAAAFGEARALGLAPALHAIGDRAVGRAVGLLSRVAGGSPPARIEHASLVPPSVMEALRRLRPYLVVQPGFVLSDVWLRDRLGPARARWAYPFRSLSDLGVPLGGSSDAPYDLPDPWRGMRAAVKRRDELGRSGNPSTDQAISEPEALALYTTGAHRALGDGERGVLEPGAPADLVVLTVPRLGEAIRRGRSAVRGTWVAGRPLPGPSRGPGS